MPRINSYDSNAHNYHLDALFADETEKSEQEQLYHLVELIIPGGLNMLTPESTELEYLRMVDANHDVVFGWGGVAGNKGDFTYSKFPLKYTPADVNSDGSISKTSINIANVSREIMYYVEHYKGLRGCRLSIKTVYANALYYTYSFTPDGTVVEVVNIKHNPSACLHDEYFIDNYSANEQIVTFQLEPIIDLEIRLPRRRYMVDSCYWKFMDTDTCGYAGTDPLLNKHCNKTLAACKEKGNQARFGGFPGISGSRKIYL